MVAPSWDNFLSPQNNAPQEVQDNIQEVPGDLVDAQKPEDKKPDWGNFDSPMTYQGPEDPTAGESVFDWTIRNITANASRVGEQALGKYGNAEKLSKELLVNYPLATGGLVGWALSELFGPEKWERAVKGQPGQQQMLPTSEDLKKTSQTLSGGYTKPKTKGEEKFQNVVEDVAAITNRRTLNQTPKNIAINNVAIPVAANVAKNVVEDTGFGKDKAEIAKAATWLPLMLANNVNARRHAADLMNEGRKGFNQNVVADVNRYQTSLNNASKNLLQGDPRASLAQQQVSAIQNDIANGRTSIKDLMDRYDAINAVKRDRGLFDLTAGDRNSAIRNINIVRDAVRHEIEEIGQANPKALQSWKNGVLAFQTIHKSNAITNYISDLARGPYAKILTGPAAALFGIGSYAGLQNPLVSMTGATTIPALHKVGRVAYRIVNPLLKGDKTLANYYWNAVSAASQDNAPAFINNYLKLNKAMEESKPAKKKTKSKKD